MPNKPPIREAVAELHPLPLFLYFTVILLQSAIGMHPFYLAVSLLGAALYNAVAQKGKNLLKDLGFYLPLWALIALTNPLFSHKGVTPLFFLNDNPVTREAIFYGIGLGAMVVSLLLWGRALTRTLTEDKVFWLFGNTFPRVGSLLSNALRTVPKLKERWKSIREAQKALGEEGSGGIASRVRADAKAFEALIGRTLEDAAESGEYLSARGFGRRKRTSFSAFRFTRRDAVLTVLILLSEGLTVAFYPTFHYYPRFENPLPVDGEILSAVSFAFLCLVPTIIAVSEEIQWKFCRSKI